MSTDVFKDRPMGGASMRERTAPATSAGRWPPVAIGALSLGLVIAGIALANTTMGLQRAWFGGTFWTDSLASFSLAGIGIGLLWKGLKSKDPVASILGYSGGVLLWMGFFEWTWRYFSVWLGIDPLMIDGQPVLPGSFLLIQASVCIFLPLTVLSVANKDTRCRMMQSIRRALRLKAPDTRNNVNRADPARVSASETVFVIWFVYLLNISLYDPRLLGASQKLYLLSLALIGIWAVYLVSRHLRIPSAGLSVRYAIPTAYLLSILIDGSTLTGLFPAFWIQPLQYPVAAASMAFVFAGCVYGLCRSQKAATTA